MLPARLRRSLVRLCRLVWLLFLLLLDAAVNWSGLRLSSSCDSVAGQRLRALATLVCRVLTRRRVLRCDVLRLLLIGIMIRRQYPSPGLALSGCMTTWVLLTAKWSLLAGGRLLILCLRLLTCLMVMLLTSAGGAVCSWATVLATSDRLAIWTVIRDAIRRLRLCVRLLRILRTEWFLVFSVVITLSTSRDVATLLPLCMNFGL